MRFVDMFMAALGALLFMAMLFAVLMKYLPTSPPPPEERMPTGPLKLISKALPSARVGVYYEVALAYRGGNGAISWDLPGGGAELSDGLAFDLSEGILRGTPSSAGLRRFVVRVRDAANASDVRPYELIILEQSKGARKIESNLVALLLMIALIACFLSVLNLKRSIGTVRMLEAAHGEGLSTVEVSPSAHTRVKVKLPEGIDFYRTQSRSAWKQAVFFVIAILALAAWFVWRVLN